MLSGNNNLVLIFLQIKPLLINEANELSFFRVSHCLINFQLQVKFYVRCINERVIILTGWLCDWTGSYDISFILMGILIAVSGCMLYLLPLVQRHCENKLTKDSLAHDVEMGKHPVTEKETMIGIEMTSSSES